MKMLRNGLALAAFIGINLANAFIGARITMPAVRTWYKRIKRAPWTPPEWVFGPVWTTLYMLMGVSAFLIWRKHDEHGVDVNSQLLQYGVNVFLNFIWTPLFFGMGYFKVACLEILLLTASTVGCIVSFNAVVPFAAYLLLPYLAWLCIATSLNIYIAINNPNGKNV